VADLDLSPLHQAIAHTLDAGQALFVRAIVDRLRPGAGSADEPATPTEREIGDAIWDLVWGGLLTNDTLAPVRARLAGGRTSHTRPAAAPRARYGRFTRRIAVQMPGIPNLPGRWSQLPARAAHDAHQAVLRTEVLLDRYGILTRGEVAAEAVPGGFSAVYPVLRQAEETGRCRRGYFVDGLGAAQFGLAGAVDRLRAIAATMAAESRPAVEALVLAATDPANPYGAALPWPDRMHQVEPGKRGHLPARKAGALVVSVDGACALYVERGGRTLLSFTDDADLLRTAADALAVSVRAGALGKLHVESADGERVAGTPLAEALEHAGFRPSPRGLRLRG
jgi:ATP-dependent Lhr-like helicase